MSEVEYEVIGFLWDDYTPQVESQMARDLIALNRAVTRYPGSVMRVCAGPEAHRLIASLNLSLADNDQQAKIWRTYSTMGRRLRAPDWATTVVSCDLTVRRSDSNKLERGPHSPYGLKEFGRMDGYDPFRRRPPQTKWATSDPLVTMIWGG